MANLLRVVAIWTGFPSAPGFSNFYFESAIFGTPSATEAALKVRQFFQSMMTILPSGVTVQVQSNVGEIDDTNGVQGDELTASEIPGAVTGLGAATRAAPAGASVNWRTSTFVNGRRLRGRTFIVPLSTSAYQDDGTLDPTALNTITNAAAALAADNVGIDTKLVVWHRPIGGAGGSHGLVTASSVSDRVAMLTSRR